MDLMTLDDEMQPAKLVNNYDSLIWTERFNQTGGFQITTGDVSTFMEMLPEGTRLTLRDSNVVMEVETHMIERKKNQLELLTIQGSSFEAILERRVAAKSLTDTSEWLVNLKTPSDLAYYVIQKICVEGILDPDDIFPIDKVQFDVPADYLTSSGPVKEFVMPRGNLLSGVLTLLQTEAKQDNTTIPVTPPIVPHGIRAIRPNPEGSLITVEIYSGTDKTEVYFDATRELLDDGTYLFSTRGSANVAYVIGAKSSAKMSAYSPGPSGFDRRVTLVDATTSGIESEEVLRQNGSMSLAEAKAIALFDGSINQDISPYTYGVDYALGDIVRLVGDYGLEQSARVTEYIRSEDVNGSASYPTLSTIVD